MCHAPKNQHLSTKAMFFYDRCLVFTREVEMLRRRHRVSVATGLYLVLQSSMAAYQFINILLDLLTTSCEVMYLILLYVHGAQRADIMSYGSSRGDALSRSHRALH